MDSYMELAAEIHSTKVGRLVVTCWHAVPEYPHASCGTERARPGAGLGSWHYNAHPPGCAGWRQGGAWGLHQAGRQELGGALHAPGATAPLQLLACFASTKRLSLNIRISTPCSVSGALSCLALLQEGFSEGKTCMKCRAPVGQIMRYGRLLNKHSIDAAERKFLQQAHLEIGGADAALSSLSQRAAAAMKGAGSPECRQALMQLQAEGKKLLACFKRLVKTASTPPTIQVYDTARCGTSCNCWATAWPWLQSAWGSCLQQALKVKGQLCLLCLLCRATVLRLAEAQQLAPDRADEVLREMVVPHPDITPALRAVMGRSLCCVELMQVDGDREQGSARSPDSLVQL